MTKMPLWAWGIFGATILVLLALDLFFARGGRAQSRAALIGWAGLWIAAATAFGAFIWISFGAKAAQDYFAAWLMEESLSLDNLFVFLLIFESLGIDAEASQHEVLFWGICGAVVLRGVFIFLGAAAMEHWHWASYLFAAVLLYAAWEAFRKNPKQSRKSHVVEWLSRHLPMKKKAAADQFLAKKNGGWAMTPLFVALVAIELSDILFAIDSVPAALSITHDRFIVYTSNIFAILSLRTLYLLMANTIGDMRYLHYGLAVVLAFAAFKMLTSDWFHIPALFSAGVILVALAAAIVSSLYARRQGSRA